MNSTNNNGQRRNFACIECYKRKIRCDKSLPCAHCNRVGLDCRYVPPLRPKRGKRLREVENEERLQRLETIIDWLQKINGNGLVHNVHSDDALQSDLAVGITRRRGESRDESRQPVCRPGIIVRDSDGCRYFDMPILMNVADAVGENISSRRLRVIDTLPTPNSMPSAFSSFGLKIAGTPIYNHNISSLRPNTEQGCFLWRKFLANCHPIIKLFNPDTAENIISRELSSSISSRGTTFTFAVFCLSVLSLRDGECEPVLGATRTIMFEKFLYGLEMALNANDPLETSNLTDLQAFVMYMLCIQAQADHGKLWLLTGLSLRMAQKIGLNRDGEQLGLPAYETEPRRRLWWHICLLDLYSSEHTGCQGSPNSCLDVDVKIPQNIEDNDLNSSLGNDMSLSAHNLMSGDMIYVQIRFEILTFVSRMKSPSGCDSGIAFFFSPEVSLKERDEVLASLERFIQDRYLARCDNSRPVQRLARHVAHAIMLRLRLIASYSSGIDNTQQHISPNQRERLWDLSCQCLDYDKALYLDKHIQNFRWHFRGFFHWAALLTLLIELLRRPAGPDPDLAEAWTKVHAAYERHPEFLSHQGKKVNSAADKLLLLAWDKYRAYLSKTSGDFYQPDYINYLQSRYTKDVEDGLSDGEKLENPAPQSLASQMESTPSFQDPVQYICFHAETVWANNVLD